MLIANLEEFSQYFQGNLRVMSVDYGIKKTGIAVSDHARLIAMPIEIINEESDKKKIARILDLAKKYDIGALVIGLPLNMDGTEGEGAIILRAFANKLDKALSLPIFLQDERLTSKAANNLLKSIGIERKRRNKIDDLASASLILETVLNFCKK